MGILFLPYFSQAAELKGDDSSILEKQAVQLQNDGKYQEAIASAKSALKMNESKYPKKNITVLQSRYNLADLYTQAGDYEAAESQLTNLRDTLIDMSGSDISNVWSLFEVYLDLADIYGKMGRTQAGAEMYASSLKALRAGMKLGKALGKFVKAYGGGSDEGTATASQTVGDVIADSMSDMIPDPEDVIFDALDDWLNWGETTLTKWARLQYYYKGDLSKTMKVYQKILDRDIMTYGKNSAAVASDLNDFALFYMSAKRYTDAEVFFKRALVIYRGIAGKDQSNVVTILQNLSELYKATGRLSDAAKLQEQALEITKTK